MRLLWPPHYISPPPNASFRAKKVRSLAILGSTGSIGRNALAVVDKAPDSFRVYALACKSNIALLAQQANIYRPKLLAVYNADLAGDLQKLLPPAYKPAILYGPLGYALLASHRQVDCMLSAQVGAAGLAASLAAALAGKVIALANKESLAIAGGMLREICRQTHASILPVDSEHYAIFQCIAGRGENVGNIILTASGGPFRGKNAEFLQKATPEQALKHPSWNMGAKITIDSATMMNKGLEIIEASRLFGFPADKIRVLVHPQSIVHSLVQFRDNSLLGQFALPDMRLPIAACLLWPHGSQSFVRPLDLAAVGTLTFEAADENLFRGMQFAREALNFDASAQNRALGFAPACIAFNAANEVAVDLFLNHKCAFTHIFEIVGKVLEKLVFKNRELSGQNMAINTGCMPDSEPENQDALSDRGDDGQDSPVAAKAIALMKKIKIMDEKARAMAVEIASEISGC